MNEFYFRMLGLDDSVNFELFCRNCSSLFAHVEETNFLATNDFFGNRILDFYMFIEMEVYNRKIKAIYYRMK